MTDPRVTDMTEKLWSLDSRVAGLHTDITGLDPRFVSSCIYIKPSNLPFKNNLVSSFTIVKSSVSALQLLHRSL